MRRGRGSEGPGCGSVGEFAKRGVVGAGGESGVGGGSHWGFVKVVRDEVGDVLSCWGEMRFGGGRGAEERFIAWWFKVLWGLGWRGSSVGLKGARRRDFSRLEMELGAWNFGVIPARCKPYSRATGDRGGGWDCITGSR